MKRPLVILTLIFCLGISAANFVKAHFWLAYFLALLFLILAFFSQKHEARFEVFLFCLIFLTGAVSLKNSRFLSKCHISRYTSYKKDGPGVITGVIDSRPQVANKKVSFMFKVREIQFNDFKISSCGNTLVYTQEREGLYYGQGLVLSGNLYRPFRGKSCGNNSYGDHLYNNGIFSIMNAKAVREVSALNRSSKMVLKQPVFRLKDKIEKLVFKRISFSAAGILDAMILGEKGHIPAPVYNAMIRSGTVHILVVSGFNVGIVAFMITLFLRIARIPRPLRFYIAGLLLIIYCMIAQAATPVVRATIMAIVFMSAYFFRREADIFNSLALAALCILGINPGQLFDIGFELSFASVISIAYFYPKLKSLLGTDTLRIKLLKFLADGALVSLSAWLGTAGIIFYYFRAVSPVTVLANIFIVPLAALITLCGFTLVIMELLLPAFAQFFALPCELSVSLMLKMNAFLLKLPFAYFW